jgi:acetolactate synthase-1/2/3 large subunit
MVEGAKAAIKTLESQGVKHVFGVCGDTSVGLYRAFARMDHDIEHILARDERSASFMADAYGRLSDRPGVCEGPSGGGATYIIPGLAEANDSSVPVVCLNTNVPVRYRGRGVLTELNQKQLFSTVTKWNTVADHPDQVPRQIRQAFREATTGKPGATHVSLPMDVLNGETEERIYSDEQVARYPAYRPSINDKQLENATTVIAESERPVIVAGGGIHTSRAWEEVRELAEKIGIPVAQTLTSAGCIGDSPYSIGVVGENGGCEYAEEVLAEADTLLLLGTAVESVWTYKWSRPSDGTKRIVHVDIDPGQIGHNYETEVALPGDLRTVVTELLDNLSADTKWHAADLAARYEEWVAEYEAEFDADEFPLRPERMVAGASEILQNDAIIISDPGTSCPYFAALYPFKEPGRNWITPRAHGALGYTIPAVVGASYARPDAQIVGFTGDGSFGTGAGELETIGRLGIDVTIVVVNNDSFSWIEAGQRNFDDFSFGVDFEGLDYASIAEEFNITGFRVESAEEYESTLEAAVETQGPVLVDLPIRPLPSIENAPVDWLEPDK